MQVPRTPIQNFGVGRQPAAGRGILPPSDDYHAARSNELDKSHGRQRLAPLVRFGRLRRWSSQANLYEAGAPALTLFWIKGGSVAEFRMLADGRRQIVAVRSAGDLCGGLMPGDEYKFSAKALTDVEAYAVPVGALSMLLKNDVDLAHALADDLMEKVSETSERVVVLGCLKAKARVAHFLLKLSDRYRSQGADPRPLPLHLSREDMADYLGMTIETVCRVLCKMERDGLVSLVRSDAVIVLDEKAMSELVTVAASRAD